MDLKPFIQSIEERKLKVEGLVVYQQGRGELRHRWTPEQKRNVFSVSKSFTSIAVGMAIEEGKLNLSDRVSQVLKREEGASSPESERRWESLTLEHLLTMNMGHAEFKRPANLREALSYELTRDPGTYFLYDNTCSFLASAMLTFATGCKVRDYLLDRLFRPLGITDPEWMESEDGYSLGATGLMLTTAEMALFGRFLLGRGNWEGRQLVSAAWLDAATRTQVPTHVEVSTWAGKKQDDYDLGYGYQFWTCRHGAYRCDGKNGQFIIVIPSHNAVVAISSDEVRMKPILWAVWDYIFPFFPL